MAGRPLTRLRNRLRYNPDEGASFPLEVKAHLEALMAPHGCHLDGSSATTGLDLDLRRGGTMAYDGFLLLKGPDGWVATLGSPDNAKIVKVQGLSAEQTAQLLWDTYFCKICQTLSNPSRRRAQQRMDDAPIAARKRDMYRSW
jgi:hypothetical protein